MDMSRQTAVLNKIKNLVAAMGVGVFASASLAAQATSDKSAIAFFDSKVHPILEENCYRCHGAKDKHKGGLRLTSRNGLVEGGDSRSAS